MLKRFVRKGKKSTKAVWITVVILFVVLLLLIGVLAKLHAERQKRFSDGTYINGVECSYLLPEEAKYRLESQSVTFKFSEGTSYYATLEKLGCFIYTEDIQKVFEEQKNGSGAEEFEVSIGINKEAVKRYLATIPELNTENMVKPKDAYLKQDTDGTIVIVPEVYGNCIELSEALNLTTTSLEKELKEIVVDFRSITDLKPNVFSNDEKLVKRKEKINNALNAKIQIELSDDSLYTLDAETIRDWVYYDEAQKCYDIEIEQHVREFVSGLSKKVWNLGSVANYKTLEGEIISLNVQWGKYDTLDEEAEIKQIMSELETGAESKRKPNYSFFVDYTNLDTFVAVNKEKQEISMYVNGKNILDEDNAVEKYDTGCVTGEYGKFDTPEGIFYLSYKEPGKFLQGRYWVDYWMPFNNDIGLHDAYWQDSFGGDRYKTGYGSQGCVNLPTKTAKKIYESINQSIPIIVY